MGLVGYVIGQLFVVELEVYQDFEVCVVDCGVDLWVVQWVDCCVGIVGFVFVGDVFVYVLGQCCFGVVDEGGVLVVGVGVFLVVGEGECYGVGVFGGYCGVVVQDGDEIGQGDGVCVVCVGVVGQYFECGGGGDFVVCLVVVLVVDFGYCCDYVDIGCGGVVGGVEQCEVVGIVWYVDCWVGVVYGGDVDVVVYYQFVFGGVVGDEQVGVQGGDGSGEQVNVSGYYYFFDYFFVLGRFVGSCVVLVVCGVKCQRFVYECFFF